MAAHGDEREIGQSVDFGGPNLARRGRPSHQDQKVEDVLACNTCRKWFKLTVSLS